MEDDQGVRPGAIELRWEGDDADGAAAMLTSRRFRSLRRRTAAIAAVALAAGVVLIVMGQVAYGIGALFAAALVAVKTAQLARRGGQAMPQVAGPQRAVAVPGEGLTITGTGIGQHHPWGAFGEVEETDRAFLLHPPGRALLPTVLPKRGVPDPAHVDALRALLADQIGRTGPVTAPSLGPVPVDGFDLAWTPQEQDWVEVAVARGRTPKLRRQLWVIGLAAILATAGSLLNHQYLLAALVAIGLTPALYLMGPGLAASARRIWRANPGLHTPQQARVRPEGLTLITGASTSHWRWDEFGALLSTPRTYVLKGNGRNFFVALPKRGLDDPERLPALDALLRRAVPG